MSDAIRPTSSRQALIIAVPEVGSDKTLSLPILRNDVSNIAGSLAQSAYDVKVIGAFDAQEATKGFIRQALRRAFEAVPLDGTILVFLTGHGLFFKGKSYLVPFDADLSDFEDPADTLFEINDALKSADGCQAKNIIIFVDTCQEGVEKKIKSVLKQMGSDAEKALRKREVAFVYACHPGELSYYVHGDNGFSIFSKALAQAFAASHPAETLGQVLEAASNFASGLAKDHDLPVQRIFTVVNDHSDIRQSVICEGGVDSSIGLSMLAWSEAVKKSRLWRLSAQASPDAIARSTLLRERVSSIVEKASANYRACGAVFPADPWHDERFPVRVLQQIEALVQESGLTDLTLSEVALLTVAPFVREDAYCSAKLAFSKADPLIIDRDVDDLPRESADLRRSLLNTHRAHPQALRRAIALKSRKQQKRTGTGSDADSARILLWLLHRHLLKFPAMWQQTPFGTLENSNIIYAKATGRADEVSVILRPDRLLRLAKAVRSDPARLAYAVDAPTADPSDEPSHPFEDAVLVENGREPIRERLLAGILCLAGWLALDPRLCDSVLVDHIGIADAVDLDDFAAAVVAANWRPTWGGTWELDILCDHPAIDYAIRSLVEEADRVLKSVNADLGGSGYSELVSRLPNRLSGEGIKPKALFDGPAYSVPHHTFTLAHHEVRELLMGEQLYGDPDLALRELYQNALDACRYRRARVEYLGRKGQPQDWTGHIHFRQGISGGRAYVECEDNGVGMGIHELEACFARAGKRFTELPEFIEERELWLQCEPKIEFSANSQFGVGVLSYFMIADEIEISTRRFRRDGRLGSRLLIDIPGTGNLFRVRQGEPQGDAGTKIRLYLRDDWSKSCCDVLEKILVVADFVTEARHGRQRLKWIPGRPRNEDRYVTTNDPNFWWDKTMSPAAMLVDGIAVKSEAMTKWGKSGVFYRRRTDAPVGYLINLKGPDKPPLTVNRKEALYFNEALFKKTLTRQAVILKGCDWLRYTWLWNLPVPIMHQLSSELSDLVLPLGFEREIGVSSFAAQGTPFDFDRSVGIKAIYPVDILGINPRHNESVVFLLEAHASKFDMKSGLGRYLQRSRLTRIGQIDWEEQDIANGAALMVALGFPPPPYPLQKYLPIVSIRRQKTLIKRKNLAKRSIIYSIFLRIVGKFNRLIPEKIQVAIIMMFFSTVFILSGHLLFVIIELIFNAILALIDGAH